MEQAVLLMAGICFLILGMSYMFRANEWNTWIHQAEKRGEQASLTFGAINLLLGSFILAFHPVWTGAATILTVMGVLAIGKSFTYMIFPRWLPAKLNYVRTSEKPLLQVSGAVFFLIALVLLNEWCAQKGIRGQDIWDGLVRKEIINKGDYYVLGNDTF